MSRQLLFTLVAVLLVPLSGCTSSQGTSLGDGSQPTTSASSTTATTHDTTGVDRMDTTRVRFSAGDAEIVIRVADNPTSRDFVSNLPLTLTFEEFAGKEKISYLSERLTTNGSSGTATRNGDLIYYVPWGNLGFFYNAGGGPSDDVITIGTVESGMDQLNRLEQGQVTVEVVS
ncbi:cyclophilin-like fold protein [Lentzea sp. NPDC005914]|uniref:cyclophilin-like fold protein n=1 Tax=Lentzea sp. NPDC005914 TaxID=3154572 RepID=UPI0033CC6A47